MSLANLLAVIEAQPKMPNFVATAVGLAATHRAFLAVLYVAPPIRLPGVAQAYLGTDILAAQERAAAEVRDSIRQDVERLAAAEGLSFEWREATGDAYDVAALHARYADLTVLGQTPPEGPEGRFILELPEHLVFTSGRPVIVVPYVGAYPTLGERVLIAWNASREAARAVNDAMPILERASSVTIIGVNPPDQETIPGTDIATHLARHGVEAEVTVTHAEDISAGDMLLSRAADFAADLIVLGAYGHSRTREWAMGGVTRHLLDHMTVPVFMSH